MLMGTPIHRRYLMLFGIPPVVLAATWLGRPLFVALGKRCPLPRPSAICCTAFGH